MLFFPSFGSGSVFAVHIVIQKHNLVLIIFCTSCVLNVQMCLLFQTVTAISYVNMDIILISQFVYYKLKNQKMMKGEVF